MVMNEALNAFSVKNFDWIAENSSRIAAEQKNWNVLKFAIDCKIVGSPDALLAAQTTLEKMVDGGSQDPAVHYELAVMYRNAKKPAKAVRHAETAARLAGKSFHFNLFYAHMLYANGAWDEGGKQLEIVSPQNPEEVLQHGAIRDFGKYLRDHPKMKAQFVLECLRRKYYWNSTEGVAAKIEKAIADQAPFSLIRLGDGDGAHFSVSQEDEERYPSLQKLTRRQHTEFLLGKDVDPVFTGYSALTTKLAEYVSEADVLGIPYPTWVDHEYDTASPVTLKCLMNINRHFYERPVVHGLQLCDQQVHMDLHAKKSLDPILKKLKSVTVISCLDELPAKVSEKFGIFNVDLIKIPSETYAPHLYGEKHLGVSLHYPHAFWPTVQKLSVPHNGHVFLIAAGTFGKYYASIIKRFGGIALDLGSLVDGWMKMISRPGYDRFLEEE